MSSKNVIDVYSDFHLFYGLGLRKLALPCVNSVGGLRSWNESGLELNYVDNL